MIQEYFDQKHAKEVPSEDLEKPSEQVFYLLMHIIHKSTRTTTKIHAVYDASATMSSGISLNSTLMVGPILHPPLVDVLVRFWSHSVALIADVSCKY